MNYENNMEKIREIYKRSFLSISRFSKLISKDRRTISSWLDSKEEINLNIETKKEICEKFRYSQKIWDKSCFGEDFLKELNEVSKKEVQIIDADYIKRLKYIMNMEANKRFVIQAEFPGPVYRDAMLESTGRIKNHDKEVQALKRARIKKMLSYDYDTTEWYSIKSILNFCFASIGNFYTKEEKIKVLDLMYDIFANNYNKKLFLFDSYSKNRYGAQTTYISINTKRKVLFFKSPIQRLFIEIKNKDLVQTIHKYYSNPKTAPEHINFLDSFFLIKILRDALMYNNSLLQAYQSIAKQSSYAKLFFKNLSIDLQNEIKALEDK